VFGFVVFNEQLIKCDEIYIFWTVYLNLRKKLINCYVWSIALYDAETCPLRKVGQKYRASIET
jgi:hypothetical protein